MQQRGHVEGEVTTPCRFSPFGEANPVEAVANHLGFDGI